MQETALWIPRGAFCPLEGGAQTHWHRHIGTSLTRVITDNCVLELDGESVAMNDLYSAFIVYYYTPNDPEHSRNKVNAQNHPS